MFIVCLLSCIYIWGKLKLRKAKHLCKVTESVSGGIVIWIQSPYTQPDHWRVCRRDHRKPWVSSNIREVLA